VNIASIDAMFFALTKFYRCIVRDGLRGFSGQPIAQDNISSGYSPKCPDPWVSWKRVSDHIRRITIFLALHLSINPFATREKPNGYCGDDRE
jgi:hypothetical protein